MDTYSIEEYDPEWVTKFQSIRETLVEIFGAKALAIEHVGSTSIPGMKGKPVIDVLILAEHVGSMNEEKGRMIESGYQYVENYIAPDTHLFRKTDIQGKRTENIHICEMNSKVADQFLIIRDYLRAHPEEVRRYSDLKDELVVQYPDYKDYRKAKNPYLQVLEKKAYEWRSQSNQSN